MCGHSGAVSEHARLRGYGTWALVCGASEGIGAAFATQLVEAGLSVVLVARRAGPLEAFAATLRRPGVEVRAVALDLGAPEAEATLRQLSAEHAFGVVVYNAALSILRPFLDTPLADKQAIIDVNVRGPLMVADVLGHAMAARGRGALILMSSLTALWGSPWVATYGATKAFNLSLGEALAAEWGPRGVDVLVCCAGATTTPGFLRAADGRKHAPAQPPEAVAAEALAAVGRRAVLVPGRLNRLATRVLGWLPRRWAVAIMGGETAKLLRV